MEGLNSNHLRTLAQLQLADIGRSEEDVKQKFLVPLLEALGHEKWDLVFERTTRAGRPDVVIRGLGVVIETKAYGDNLGQHLVQLGNYAVHDGALIAVITNGEEVRLYSPLRGISFERSLLYSIRREDVGSEMGIEVLGNLLSRTTLLTNSQVHGHIEAREQELRRAYTELDELNEKYGALREEINADIATLEEKRRETEAQIDAKHKERSGVEVNQQSELTAIWRKLGLKPDAESRRIAQPITRPQAPRPGEEPTDEIDYKSLILETLSEMGGRGRVRDVLGRIEDKLETSGKLTPYLRALDPQQIRWVHSVHSARSRLDREGKLAKTPKGTWELRQKV